MGKGSKSRKPRRQFKPNTVPQRQAIGQPPPPRGEAERPTVERLARGHWANPQGPMPSAQPIVALDCDAVGRMFRGKLIGKAEEQAARQFEEARAAFLTELPDVSQFKSCLAGSVPGYDDGEGDPVVIDRYRKMEKLLSCSQRVRVIKLCEEDWVPINTQDYHILRTGLMRIAGLDNRKKSVA